MPGGFRACLAAIGDPSVRVFFEQRFNASEWYDAYPGAMLESAAARVRGVGFETHRRQTGAWHAQRTARGIYGALLRLVSNESVALRGPRISSLYFEFGKTETHATGPREVLGVRRGIPRELAQWMMYASYGFCSAALKLAGARDAMVIGASVEPDGEAHGRELVRVPIRISWS